MTDQIPIVFPKDTHEGTQSFLAKWLKRVGDVVALHEPVAEISTDKVIVEIPSPASGIVAALSVQENAEVRPGDLLGYIDPAAVAETETPAAVPNRPSGGRAPEIEEALSPAVKRLLKEHSLNPAQITGTGKGGRITTDDVLKYAASAPSTPARKVPHTPMRKTIARHLTESVATAPHVTTVFECDFTEVLKHKASLQGRVTLTAYIIRALVHAVRVVPEVNSRWHDDFLEIFSAVNVGIGTAMPDGGLVVPVIRNVQTMSLEEIAARLADLTARARDNSLTREDVAGGTISISNHGMSGSLLATPIIINQPQSSILGMGKMEKRVTVVSDAAGERMEIRPLCYITLTIDHRVLDGFQANACLSALKGWLEGGVY